MEPKTLIFVNNQKYFEPKNKLNLEEIRNFIKEEYKIPKESFIELYTDNDPPKKINFERDLESLKQKYEQINEYIIKIKFKERKQFHFNVPLENKNKIKVKTEIIPKKKN